MAGEQTQLEPLSPEAEQLELLPQSEPERQYCLFRAGRERFCFSVLDVEEVVEWPSLTLACASMARTSSVCWPSASPVKVCGSVTATNAPLSNFA